jgi:hypothetical protein
MGISKVEDPNSKIDGTKSSDQAHLPLYPRTFEPNRQRLGPASLATNSYPEAAQHTQVAAPPKEPSTQLAERRCADEPEVPKPNGPDG